MINILTSHSLVEPAVNTQPEKNPAPVALGRLGGLKGGKARAAKLPHKKVRNRKKGYKFSVGREV